MTFFQNFQQVYYTLTDNAPPVIVTNIMQRVKVRNFVKKNAAVFYTYSVKDTDTPEIIAHKYYGSADRYWIVLLANDIIDPNYDWPLKYDDFNNYIVGKYGSVQAAQTTTDHYEKWITKTDSTTGNVDTRVYVIDEDTYNALVPSNITYNLTNGAAVNVAITKNLVVQYDQENALNDAKKTIKLVDSQYVQQIEAELASLLST